MSVSRGNPRPPPPGLGRRDLQRFLVPLEGDFWRLAHEKAPLLDYSDSAESRFGGPTLPTKVLYIAERKETCFWERFGQALLDQEPNFRGLPSRMLTERVWKKIGIKRAAGIQCLDLTQVGALRAMSADVATFLAPYPITHAWAEELMKHPSGIGCLRYQSRLDNPSTCLALFERAAPAVTPNFQAAVDPLRPSDDPEIVGLLLREGISLLKPPE